MLKFSKTLFGIKMSFHLTGRIDSHKTNGLTIIRNKYPMSRGNGSGLIGIRSSDRST